MTCSFDEPHRLPFRHFELKFEQIFFFSFYHFLGDKRKSEENQKLRQEGRELDFSKRGRITKEKEGRVSCGNGNYPVTIFIRKG